MAKLHAEHFQRRLIKAGVGEVIETISPELLQVANLLNIGDTDMQFRKCIAKMPINKLKHTITDVWWYMNQIGMIIPDGYVAVDVDNMDDSLTIKNILDDKGINYIGTRTKKGRHFIFKYNGKYKLPQGAKLWTPIGIEVDTRVAGKGYLILPEGGERNIDPQTGQPTRVWENIPDTIDYIPSWLIVDDKLKHFFRNETLHLAEGNRDNTMFKYIKFLSDFTDLTQNDVQEITQIINENLFDPPMDWSKEILTKIQESDFEAGRRKISRQEETVTIAKELMEDMKIKKYAGELFTYTGVKYKQLVPSEIKGIVLHDYNELMPRQQRNELVDFIEDFALEEEDKDMTTHKRQIATPSQVIDLKTMAITPNDGSIFNFNNIQFEYVYKNWETNPAKLFVDHYFQSLFDYEDEINLIYEMIGYSMLSYSPFRKSFFLVGPAFNGKSFLVERIATIFGNDNVSAVELDTVSKDPRMAKSLKTSLINIPDDMSDVVIENESMFKKLVSGELIEIDVKGKDSIKFQPSSTWIMTSNYDPKFKKSDDGIYTRIILIRFKKKITPIADYEDYWTSEHYEYIVWRAINAINLALNNGSLTIPQTYYDEINRLKIEDSVIMNFMSEVHPNFTNKYSVKALFQEFEEWRRANNFGKMTSREFKDEICSMYNLTVVQTTNSNDIVNPGNINRYVMVGSDD